MCMIIFMCVCVCVYTVEVAISIYTYIEKVQFENELCGNHRDPLTKNTIMYVYYI